MVMEDVFARVLRQAAERRAEHERILAEERRLAWQRALVLRLLVRRFGAVPEEVVGRVNGADGVELDRYVDRVVMACSLEGVFVE
jgi:hypothetical protein